MEPGPAILQLTSGTSVGGKPVCIREFAQHGLSVISCKSVADATRHVWARQRQPDARIVIIIDGRVPDGASIVSALRALCPRLGIVALTSGDNDADVIQLLHMGADAYCPADASAALLVAIVLRLLWRLGMPSASAVAPSSEPVLASSSWELIEQGWILRSPTGRCVTLTTGERAFLTTLFNAPSFKASHAELIDAVNASYNHVDGHVHQGRLGVTVSRMRRKFSQAGAPLPLKSVHNWGYMFVMDTHADDASFIQ